MGILLIPVRAISVVGFVTLYRFRMNSINYRYIHWHTELRPRYAGFAHDLGRVQELDMLVEQVKLGPRSKCPPSVHQQTTIPWMIWTFCSVFQPLRGWTMYRILPSLFGSMPCTLTLMLMVSFMRDAMSPFLNLFCHKQATELLASSVGSCAQGFAHCLACAVQT